MGARAQPPSELELVDRAVKELSRRTGFPVAFGGLFADGQVNVTALHGVRTRHLEGLRVAPDHGLGGKAFVELRPRMTQDYGTSRTITHDYDEAVLGEGISTLLAVPVIVDGRARGVLYGGAWRAETIGDVAAAPAFQVAEALAGELRMRDEIDRRVAVMTQTSPILLPPPPLSAGHRERLRQSYAELRSISSAVSDPELRRRLAEVERVLSEVAGDVVVQPNTDLRLSPREIDVLSCAALGGTNTDIAQQLGLKPGTVKAYLGTAMAKLGASTRAAAVAQARMAGLLP